MVRRRGRFVILVLVRIILILLNEFSRRNFGILFSILLAVDGIITGFTSLSLSVRGHLNSPQKPRTILLGAPTAPFLDTFSSNSRKGRASVSLRVFEMLQTADCALGTLDGGVGFSGTPSATLDRHMLDFVNCSFESTSSVSTVWVFLGRPRSRLVMLYGFPSGSPVERSRSSARNSSLAVVIVAAVTGTFWDLPLATSSGEASGTGCLGRPRGRGAVAGCLNGVVSSGSSSLSS